MDRILFKKGIQRRFIRDCASKVGSLKELSLRVEKTYSSIRHYAQESYSLPSELFSKLEQIHECTYKIRVKKSNWGAIKGGKKSISTLMQKDYTSFKKRQLN